MIGLEQVLGELRQVAGAVGRVVLDQQRRVVLGVAEVSLGAVCRSSMNAPSARSSRASAPFSTTKRAPEIFAAVSKSIRPSASPISKCCLRLEVETSAASPTLRTSLLSFSSLPTGTSSSGRLGMTASASRSALSTSRSLLLALGEHLLQRRHLGHQLRPPGLVLRRLGLADLLRGRVAARLRLLQLASRARGAPRRARSARPTAAPARAS